MPEAQQSSYVQSPEQSNHLERPSFRTAPWFILRKGAPVSKGTALVFSVIWAAITDLSSPDKLTTYPVTNEEIGKRSGIRGGAQAALKHIQKLEKIGFIKRHKKHKGRYFEVLVRPDDDNYLGLTISGKVFKSNLSPTQKLLITIKEVFPRAGKSWICSRLGISNFTYYYNLNKLQPYKESNSNPIKNLTQPYKESNPIGIVQVESLGGVALSKDKANDPSGHIADFETPLYQGDGQKPPLNENNTPALKQENYMAPKIAYDTPADPAEVEMAIRRARQSRAKSNPRSDLRPKKKIREFKPTNDGRYEKRYIDELEYIREQYPLINISKPGTWIYDNALGIVRALTIGPIKSKVLRPDEVNAILSVMVGKQPGNLNYPLSREYIMRNFLDRSFSDEDRIELYTRLNNMQSAEYKGNGQKVELSWAMRSRNNYSWLLHLWFAPPRRPQEEFPPDLGEYRPQYERALGLMPVNMAKEREGQLAWIIRGLRKRYNDEFRDRRPAGYDGNTWYGTWTLFFKELAEYFDRQNADIWPGWFNPNGQTVRDFLADAGFRPAGRPSCRPQGYNKGKEAEHVRV